MTEAGSRNVARDELQRIVGGPQRAAELGQGMRIDREFGLTPAQQSEDPGLLALERAAAEESPLLRERLVQQAATARIAGEAGLRDMGGDPDAARDFFSQRLRQVKASFEGRVDNVMRNATETVEGIVDRSMPEGAASSRMVAELKGELDDALQQERALWAAVPKAAAVETTETRALVRQLIDGTPWAQRRDIPGDLLEAFGENGAIGEQTDVQQLYGLYSEMRRVARSAMAGNDQNKNRARIANAVADAILVDLGAVDAETAIGRTINEARAFSRGLHETFDQGTVGRILKRTIDGDETMTPEGALRRTVGRGGPEGEVAAREIEDAAQAASTPITDYLRRDFVDKIVDPSGKFTPAAAKRWMRDNRDTLRRYPGLATELRRALTSREAADAFAVRAEARLKLAEDSAAARFTRGPIDKAVPSILGADSPAKAARAIRLSAARDRSGAAMAGVKGAFSDYLIGGATARDGALSGARLTAVLNDPKMSAAIRQIFSGPEIARMRQIATALQRVEAAEATPSAGAVINRPANRLVDIIARVGAARAGGQYAQGSMGGSLQTANIFAGRAQELVGRMTNARARELLIDAIEDPELMQTLLLDSGSARATSADVRRRLEPYFLGATSAAAGDDSE